jgi:ribosomal protein S18 acetylase RimI-like enzyme
MRRRERLHLAQVRTLIRELDEHDFEAVLRIQANAYPAHMLEVRDVFRQKRQAFPAGCLGYAAGGELAAYVFSHPWGGRDPVSLHSTSLVIPPAPDCYYIHDLAVHASVRGQGVAEKLFRRLTEIAGAIGLRTFALVAVQQSEDFWRRFGFEAVRSLTYTDGIPATFMVRSETSR